MRRLVVAAALLIVACDSDTTTPEDAIVHTDRIGYHDAYALGPNVASGDVRPILPAATILPPGASLIDLTHPFDDKTLYWPSDETGFELSSTHRGRTEAGWFYAANNYSAPEHGGTHIDAPSHFAESGLNVDKLPLGRLLGPAVVIDISADAEQNADALLEPAAIEAFEQQHGPIAPNTIVLVRTGWSTRWPNRNAYLGDSRMGKTDALHFPGISEAAAKALVLRQVSAVGIDTASLDNGPSRDFLAHRALAAGDIPGFENVTRLDMLPPTGALVLALPMKIANGTGSPLRIVAVVPPKH
ncbi:MAG TPA: cyclase family protein [Nannocystaceae bacterium]|nr:cyclase family protein [Nannocystaceae bacterium]